MTYMKPELLELVSAAHAIRGGSSDSGNSDKGTSVTEAVGDSGDTGINKSSTTAAYQVDE